MKKYINLLMGVVCALVSCTIAYADGPVKEGNAIVGHVIEKGSEAGLPYATVLLVETGEGTVTDAEGRNQSHQAKAVVAVEVRNEDVVQPAELQFGAAELHLCPFAAVNHE